MTVNVDSELADAANPFSLATWKEGFSDKLGLSEVICGFNHRSRLKPKERLVFIRQLVTVIQVYRDFSCVTKAIIKDVAQPRHTPLLRRPSAEVTTPSPPSTHRRVVKPSQSQLLGIKTADVCRSNQLDM